MRIGWHFKAKRPGDTIREPIQGEFFSGDAISQPGMALIREGIQNSLDAAIGGSRATVKIGFFSAANGIARTEFNRYIQGAMNHILAKNNGLDHSTDISLEKKYGFITFEDFSTSGLIGDYNAPFKTASDYKNSFYHFFRAEGQSDKGPAQRGSWGIGKTVFNRASRISTIFGLTVRHDDGKSLLMGKCVLKTHSVNGEYFQEGYYGILASGNDCFTLPTEDQEVIDSFIKDFKLKRNSKSSGLSIVIPMPEDIATKDTIISTIIAEYYYPILAEQLDVQLTYDGEETNIRHDNIHSLARIIDNKSGHFASVIDLAKWGISNNKHYSTLSMEYNWDWRDGIIEEDDFLNLKTEFLSGNKVSVRCNLSVRKREEDLENSHFDLLLHNEGAEAKGSIAFIREGLKISNVRAPKPKGVTAIIVIQHKPLAEFLRAAENPSHTEWQHSLLKHKYAHGCVKNLEFIQGAARKLVEKLTQIDEEEDASLLTDFFSLEDAVDDTQNTRKPKSKKGTDSGKPRVDIKGQSKIAITRIESGFSIAPGYPGCDCRGVLEIRAAYNTHSGSPLSKYKSWDFEFIKGTLKMIPERKNVEILRAESNLILIRVMDDDFRFSVSGFDKNRELFIKVKPREDLNGN